MSDKADKKQEEMPESSRQVENGEELYNGLNEEELVTLLEEKDRRIAELEQESETARDSHLRKAAELENIKKRIQRERVQLFETARAKALEDFLAVNDDLRRTLKAFEESEVNKNIMDGISLVAGKFQEILSRYGVERIDEEMVPFDVDLHDAMMRQKPEDESVGSDMVLKVLENGYRMGDRTIRHAKVIVSE